MRNKIFCCILFSGVLGLLIISSCKPKSGFYSVADFGKVPKIDSHFHYNTRDVRYLKFADSLNFKLVSPNVDTEMPIDSQLVIASWVKKQFPDKFAFFGTFSIDSFGKPDFAKKTIARIDRCMKAGACGIKIWKNIGMVLKDSAEHYVMVDNPAFDLIFNYMETNHIHLIAHLGEPRNCWLPEKEMIVDGDRRYYKKHPQYYMYVHPEAPTYDEQIAARDNLLKKHPNIQFTGAHLASLEWSVDELAKRFDQFPDLTVDMAARITSLQYQSSANRDKVRNFLIKYQDRILYATDITISKEDTDFKRETTGIQSRWLEHWKYMVTDSLVVVPDLGNRKVQGLQLPKEVIDKIYCRNAERFFKPVNK
jgi:hypothetical protein